MALHSVSTQCTHLWQYFMLFQCVLRFLFADKKTVTHSTHDIYDLISLLLLNPVCACVKSERVKFVG